jgi:hypothetical protein
VNKKSTNTNPQKRPENVKDDKISNDAKVNEEWPQNEAKGKFLSIAKNAILTFILGLFSIFINELIGFKKINDFG